MSMFTIIQHVKQEKALEKIKQKLLDTEFDLKKNSEIGEVNCKKKE